MRYEHYEPIQPPDWLRDTLKASDPHWRDTPQPAPLTLPPALAVYEEHPCPACGKPTSYELCGGCQIQHLDQNTILHEWRARVRDGHFSDWEHPNYDHAAMMCDWMCAPPEWQAWRGFVWGIVARMLAAGYYRRRWLFHPDCFGDDRDTDERGLPA